MIEDVEDLVNTAVREVFGTMLNLQLSRVSPDTVTANGQPHVAGSVGFIGRLTGVIYLHTTVPFARRITGILWGLSQAEIQGDEMVNDAIGEMANMVLGHLKSRLSDRGIPCVLTIPSIVRGSQFSIEAVSSIQTRIFAFLADPDLLLVEVLIRPTK